MPVFSGTAAADRLVGSAAADQLYGLDGNDLLYGVDGDDWLVGGLGNDTMIGGLGNDSYDVDSASDVVVERAGEGIDGVRAWVNYQLSANVETLTLAGTADLVGTGNALDNTIVGNAGNNVLNGAAGNDVLAGGKGDDVYDVDSAGDKVVEAAGEGHDRVRSLVSFTLGANVEDLTLGGTGDLIGIGNALNNTIIGNAGDNVLHGGAGDDLLIGRAGDDVYDVDSYSDKVIEAAGEGHDRIRTSLDDLVLPANVEDLAFNGAGVHLGYGNALDNEIIGNAGNDLIFGGAGNDVLFGNGGNDFIYGMKGDDTMVGGAGDDQYDVDSAGDRVREVAGEGTDLVHANVSFALSANIENLTLDDTQNINGFGNDLANTIIGNVGNNVLHGGAGDDVLVGHAGNDVYDVDSAGDQVQEAAGEGYDRVRALVDYTLSANVEELDLVGNADIYGIGNSLDNTIIGNVGANIIDGAAGNDWIYGGDGADSIRGGVGFDLVFGGSGDDYINIRSGDLTAGERYDGGEGTADSLSLTWVTGSKVIDLSVVVVTGIERLSSSFDNVMMTAGQLDSLKTIGFSSDLGSTNPAILQVTTGGLIDLSDAVQLQATIRLSAFGNEVRLGTIAPTAIEGGAGNDVVHGADGPFGYNNISGGDGDDLLIGGQVGDSLSGGAGNDHIDGGGGLNYIYGGDGNDTLQGGESHDFISGGADTDLLMGAGYNDELRGGAGNDRLIGGEGADWLYGDEGSDSFVFLAADSAIDEIYDFRSAEGDKLVFEGLLHGTFVYRGTDAFTASGNTEARYVGGVLMVDIDGNGTADIGATVSAPSGGVTLHASDFVFS